MVTRLLFFLTFLIIPFGVSAQVSDDFSDSTFARNPAWEGDTSAFVIDTLGRLWLNAPAVSDTAYLSISSKACYKASWQFSLQMDFNASSSNYAKVFLTSTTKNLKGALDGYFIRVGYTNDEVSFYRKVGKTETLLMDGRDKMVNTDTVRASIKVTRDENSLWTIYCDSTGGTQWVEVGHCLDSTITTSVALGVFCKYSSTRSKNFHFDDFIVTGDTFPPIILPDTVINPVDTTPVVVKDTADYSQLFDVVFNEVMADPSPVAGLPEVEYLELYNRSDSSFSLKNWTLLVGTSSCKFPDIRLDAKAYLVICAKSDTTYLQPYGTVVGLYSSSTSLANTGQHLRLNNSQGELIHWLNFTDIWYKDEFKMQGGYSLEQIDPNNPCGGSSNWTASNARKGGTPGIVNSVLIDNPDVQSPLVTSINVSSDTTIEVRFNESMDTVMAFEVNRYTITPGIGSPKYVQTTDYNFSLFQLTLSQPLQSGTTYQLLIGDSLCDCAGSKLKGLQSFSIGLPTIPKASDLVFNEVRFNAPTGGEEYIELYNLSARFFDAHDILIGKQEEGQPKEVSRISDDGFLIPPSTYLLISQKPECVSTEFSIDQTFHFHMVNDLLALDDQSATLVLFNDTFGTVDEFTYSEKMHATSLNSYDGVALERVNPSKASALSENWHSASEESGYGTPGYKNSQYLSDFVSGTEFTIEHELFSPDNDGYHDNLQVTYQFKEAGIRAEVSVYDVSGRLIRRLYTNRILGTSGDFLWDGNDNSGKRCAIGPYLLFIRTVSESGTVHEYRKSCVLAIKR